MGKHLPGQPVGVLIPAVAYGLADEVDVLRLGGRRQVLLVDADTEGLATVSRWSVLPVLRVCTHLTKYY